MSWKPVPLCQVDQVGQNDQLEPNAKKLKLAPCLFNELDQLFFGKLGQVSHVEHHHHVEQLGFEVAGPGS